MAKQANNKPDGGAPPQGNAGNGVPPSVNTAGNETQTPDSGAKPGDTPPPQGGGNETGKKKIRHPGKKGKKLFVGVRLIQFDAEGVVELDDSEAAILLGFEGYEEV